MNKIRISFLYNLVLVCGFLTHTYTDASWLTRHRNRRSERLQKDTEIKNSLPRKHKDADLKALIDTSDDLTEIAATNQTVTPQQQDKKQPSIFDEDKFVLPPELQPTPQKELKKLERKPEECIELQFENADLENLIKQIEAIFEVTFITDDMIESANKQAKGTIRGNKISFKTNRPLTKQQTWGLFLTFLEIAGFSVVKQPEKDIYRIEQLASARRSAIPAYIGSKLEELPSNDQIIRYVYFIENSSIDSLRPVVESLKSKDAPLVVLQDHKAFILTDKAYNIKTLMNIVKELDKTSMPQAMSVLKLQRADAQQVKKLYDSLIQADQGGPGARMLGPRKSPTSLYFPENTRIIAEPRTNSLILLGAQDAIKKIEDFIKKNVDVDLEQPYSPLYVYQLKYADAATVANIMTKVTEFGRSTAAGQSGGVRGDDKYMQPIAFIPEKETNQLVIKGNYEDYLAARNIIEKLDEPQPQVAIEVLILDITLQDQKNLGAQIRSKVPGINGLVGNNIKFQTSGLFGKGIVENQNGPGVDRLLGNLVDLVTGVAPGNTIFTLGQDIFGVWGVLSILQTITNVQIVSNPFLVATNKTPAKVKLGETRRVVSGQITTGSGGEDSFDDSNAFLEVGITPQINSDGMIIMELEVHIDQFTNRTDQRNGNKSVKHIKTHTIVADKEVLALGGLIKNTTDDNMSKVPVLGNIPILGWLFKNRQKREDKTNLLVLISSQIIKPQADTVAKRFTDEYLNEYNKDRASVLSAPDLRDPITRSFFRPQEVTQQDTLDNFLFKRRVQSSTRRTREFIKNKKENHIQSVTQAELPQKTTDTSPINNSTDQATIPIQTEVLPEQITAARIKKRKLTRQSLHDFVVPDEEAEA